MCSARESLEADVDAGFEILHIDTSVGPDEVVPTETAIDRLLELYTAAHEAAVRGNRSVSFEVGLERQAQEVGDPAEFEHVIETVLGRIAAARLPRPVFVVAQTGTKVEAASNVGDLTRADLRTDALSDVQALSDVCRKNGCALKAHNVDYLEPVHVRDLMLHGVDAINVAPEFGVRETRSLLRLMGQARADDLRSEFLSIALESGRWSSWLGPRATSAADLQKATLAGHYVFAEPRVRAIVAALGARLARSGGPSVGDVLTAEARALVSAYLGSTMVRAG